MPPVDPAPMTVTEYHINGYVRLRMTPAFTVISGEEKPLFWYFSRPVFLWDADRLGWTREDLKSAKDVNLDTLYWNGEKWAISTPKQYPTPEAAYEDWLSNVKDKS